MTPELFRQRPTIDHAWPPVYKALWYDAQGNWTAAHDALQDDNSRDGAWVHAYLHRVEGDEFNAAYWYRRAGKPVCTTPLATEWTALVAALIKE